MRPALFLIVLALAGSFLGAAPAFAQRGDGVLPLDQILPEIRRNRPGQFYDADGPNPGPGGSQHYSLKWMTPDGRIEWLDADARTGRVLPSGRGNFERPRRQPDAAGRGNFRDDRPWRGDDPRSYDDDRGRRRGR